MKRLSGAIPAFLAAQRNTHPGQDLLDRYLEHGTDLETQVNVDPADSEPVAGKRATWDTGTYQYWNIRIPKNAKSDPVPNDYKLSWPLELHAEGIGSTGWHWRGRKSLWVGFDFDAITGHARGVGITDEKLAEVRRLATSLPYIEARRSTSGRGLHLYAHLDAIPTANHTRHAILARGVLRRMRIDSGIDSGIDFSRDVDCYGSVMWIWHRKMAPDAYELLSPATQTLTLRDIMHDLLAPNRAAWAEDVASEDVAAVLDNIDWDCLARSHPPIPEDAEHRRIIDQLASRCTWDPEHRCYRTHTSLLASIDHRGEFATLSPGTDLQTPNCYLYRRPSGVFQVLRYGTPTEAEGWDVDADGQPSHLYNVPPPPTRYLTCAQLDSTHYDVRYLIPGILVAGQPAFLGGPKKALKTSLAIELAVSLATGTQFLGRFNTQQTSTLMLSGESGMSTLQETARRICTAKDLSLPSIDNLYWSEWLPRLDKDLDTLETMIQETGARVLVIDPLYLCLSGTDASNLFVQGQKLRPLRDLCQRHQLTPILLHHTRKRGKDAKSYEPTELDDLAWAGFAEFARQWMLVARRGPYVPGTGQHELWLTVGGSAGHSGQWALDIDEGTQPRYWEVSLSSPSDARAERRATTIRERIIEAARNYPEGETKTGILSTVNLKNSQPAKVIFAAMVEEGVLMPVTLRRQRRSYDAYQLA